MEDRRGYDELGTPTMYQLLLLFLLAAPVWAQSPLCTQLAAEVEASAAHWGLSVTSLDGTFICRIDDTKLFRPASNAKLFTTAAALALLGPDKTFETQVRGRLDAETGTVLGDLTLIGAGDANLDSGDLPYTRISAARVPPDFRDLNDLAAQLAAKNVKSVQGDIVGDDTLFPYEPFAAGWELDDVPWGYGAPVSALTLADNQLHLEVTAGRSGLAVIAIDQRGVGYYTIEGRVAVDPEHPTGIQIQRLPGSRVLHLSGSIRPGSTVDEEIAIDDPAEFAAMEFRAMLIAHGIQVDGKARAKHRLQAAVGCQLLAHEPVLATHRSAPLGADVLYTNKTSQNLHAELLFHALALGTRCADGSTLEGTRAVRAFLTGIGIAPEDTVFYDGSGLSSHDLITPSAVTQLLGYAVKQPWFAPYKQSLPVGGVDGSLASRFTGALKGRVLAKTGSLGETRALSGFLSAASGRTIIFSILEDSHLPETTTDRTMMDHLVEEIAAAN